MVEVAPHDFTGERPIAQAKAWAKEHIVGEHELTDGTPYTISNSAVDKYLSRSATDKSENLGVHLSVLKQLPEVISESIDAEVHPDYKKGDNGVRRAENGIGNGEMLVHRLYGAVEIEGVTYRVKTTLHEHIPGKRGVTNTPHSFEVTKIEVLDESNTSGGAQGHIEKTSTLPLGTAKLLKGVEKSYENGKKLLDESRPATAAGDLRFRDVEDDAVLTEFAEGKTVKAYRTMQVIDGKLYSPMATKVGGKSTPAIRLGVPEQSEEHPEIIKSTKVGRDGIEQGYVVIDKGLGKGSLTVAYNPYIHASRTVLNDQFSSAHIRPNLVTVEVEVPESELKSGYRANMAKDAVGEISWHSGSVSGQLSDLGKPRRVILSRYDRPVRIVPFREVAGMIARQLDGTDIAIPFNVVQPQLRAELERLGVAISEEATGTVGDDPGFGKAEYITDQEIERINARQQLMSQTSPEAKSGHAERLARKLNTPVRIVNDPEELTHPDAGVQEKMRKEKGFYNVRSGEVVIVVPNNADVEDVAETVLHEVVAHKGLREMLGEENYDAFCDEVYDHLKDDLKEEVDREATRRFEREPEKGYEHHRRVSVDEMFGRMAEKGFEDFTKAERGIWAKLKAKVLEAINRFLGSLKLPKWVKLGDNELRYMLWRSHERLRTKGDYVDMARDAAKREELGLNRNDVIKSKINRTWKEKCATLTEVSKEKSPKENAIAHSDSPSRAETPGYVHSRSEKSVAKVAKVSDNLKSLSDNLPESGLKEAEIILEISRALGVYGASSDRSSYSVVNVGNDVPTTIRVSGHSAIPANFGRTENNVGIVIKTSVHRFRPDSETDYVEFMYYGDNVRGNAKLQRAIVDGLRHYVNTGSFEKMPEADRLNTSGEYMAALKRSERDYRFSDSESDIWEDRSDTANEEEGKYGFRFRDSETGDIWEDRSVGLEERITNAAIRLSNNQSADLTLRNDAMRAIGGNLTSLRKAMAAQKRFDQTTVKRVADLATILMQNGYLSGMTSGEIQRLISAVKNSVGHKEVKFTGERPIAQAKAWAKEHIVGERELTDGTPYTISNGAVDKYLSRSATDKSENLGVHLSVLKQLPEVIVESIDAEVHPDYKKGDNGVRRAENGIGNENMLVHRLYGAVNIEGVTYRTKTTLHEYSPVTNDVNSPHSFEVTKIEVLDESNTSENGARDPISTKGEGLAIETAKLLKGVEKSYENGKKLLDESGPATAAGDLRFRDVEDDAVLTEFAEGKTVKAYRTMQVIDGKLYSPMATKAGGKSTPAIRLGVPEQSEEHPEIVKRTKVGRDGTEQGYVVIDKGLGKGSLTVAYNPYIHASRTVLNDQFLSAHIRPNLVTVEVEVPESELKSGYRANMAKNAVGEISWHKSRARHLG